MMQKTVNEPLSKATTTIFGHYEDICQVCERGSIRDSATEADLSTLEEDPHWE